MANLRCGTQIKTYRLMAAAGLFILAYMVFTCFEFLYYLSDIARFIGSLFCLSLALLVALSDSWRTFVRAVLIFLGAVILVALMTIFQSFI